MDLSTLSYFIEICEAKNISKAADALFLTRQTLSQAVRSMERELGATLIERKHTGIELTEEGECLFSHARELVSAWQRAVDEIGAIHRMRQVTLRAGFGLMSFHLWDVGHSRAFMETHPHASVEISTMPPDQLWDALEAKHLDVIVTNSVQSEEARYHYTLLRSMQTYIMLSEEDPLAAKASLSIQDLEGKTIFLTPGSTMVAKGLECFAKKMDVRVRFKYCLSEDFVALCRILEKYQGVSLGSAFFVDYVKGMVLLKLEEPKEEGAHYPRRDIYAVTLSERAADSTMEAYIRYLKKSHNVRQ